MDISKKELEKLQYDSRLLEALYAGGLERWEEYDDVMDSFYADEHGYGKEEDNFIEEK